MRLLTAIFGLLKEAATLEHIYIGRGYDKNPPNHVIGLHQLLTDIGFDGSRKMVFKHQINKLLVAQRPSMQSSKGRLRLFESALTASGLDRYIVKAGLPNEEESSSLWSVLTHMRLWTAQAEVG